MGRRQLLSLLVVAGMLLAACGGEDGADEVAVGASAGDAPCPEDEDSGPYFLYEGDGWEFRSGTDYPPDDGPLARVETSLDWFAEHERFTPSTDGATVEGVSLRLSGHEADVAGQRNELQGFRTEDAEVDGHSAYTGVSPDGEPTVVGVAIGDGYTVMLLSYGLDVDELVEVASSIEQVCQEAWIGAGGRVLTCAPLAPACNPPSSSTSVPSSTTSVAGTTTTGP